jgi:hypothetical protein
LLELGAFPNRSIQEQPVEHSAGKNCDRLVEFEANPPPPRTHDFAGRDPISFHSRVAQKLILREGFMRDAATAGFLPGRLLIEQQDAASGLGELSGCEGTGRTGTDNGNGGSSHPAKKP